MVPHLVGGPEEERGGHHAGEQCDDQRLHQLPFGGRALGDRGGAGERQPQRQRAERHREGALHPVQTVQAEQPAVAEGVGDRGEQHRHHPQHVPDPDAAGLPELGEDHAHHDQHRDAEGAQRDPAAAQRAEGDAGDDHQLPGGGHEPSGAVLAGPGERRVEESEADRRPEQPVPRAGPQAAEHRGESAAQGDEGEQRHGHEQLTSAPRPKGRGFLPRSPDRLGGFLLHRAARERIPVLPALHRLIPPVRRPWRC